ncbi:hypothetical protein BGX38DRAFT_54080 [Terfezia claveryi]|nr:hypothetical protein BGX38DRAFT_54080 [Terfezia claveryi]
MKTKLTGKVLVYALLTLRYVYPNVPELSPLTIYRSHRFDGPFVIDLINESTPSSISIYWGLLCYRSDETVPLASKQKYRGFHMLHEPLHPFDIAISFRQMIEAVKVSIQCSF